MGNPNLSLDKLEIGWEENKSKTVYSSYLQIQSQSAWDCRAHKNIPGIFLYSCNNRCTRVLPDPINLVNIVSCLRHVYIPGITCTSLSLKPARPRSRRPSRIPRPVRAVPTKMNRRAISPKAPGKSSDSGVSVSSLKKLNSAAETRWVKSDWNNTVRSLFCIPVWRRPRCFGEAVELNCTRSFISFVLAWSTLSTLPYDPHSQRAQCELQSLRPHELRFEVLAMAPIVSVSSSHSPQLKHLQSETWRIWRFPGHP